MKRTAKTIAIAFLITISLLVTACSANQAGASPQDEILSEPAIESEVSVDNQNSSTAVPSSDDAADIDDETSVQDSNNNAIAEASDIDEEASNVSNEITGGASLQDAQPISLNTRYTGTSLDGEIWFYFTTGSQAGTEYIVALENQTADSKTVYACMIDKDGNALAPTERNNDYYSYGEDTPFCVAKSDGVANSGMINNLEPNTNYYIRLRGAANTNLVLEISAPSLKSDKRSDNLENAEDNLVNSPLQDTSIIAGSSQSAALNIPLDTTVYSTINGKNSFLSFTTTKDMDAAYYITTVNSTVNSKRILVWLLDASGKAVDPTERDNDYYSYGINTPYCLAEWDGTANTGMINTLEPNTTYYIQVSGEEGCDFSMRVSSSHHEDSAYQTNSRFEEAKAPLNESDSYYTGSNQNISTMLKINTLYHGHYEDGYSWVAFKTLPDENTSYTVTVENFTEGSKEMYAFMVDEYGYAITPSERENTYSSYSIAAPFCVASPNAGQNSGMVNDLRPDTVYYIRLEGGSETDYTIIIGTPQTEETPSNTIEEEIVFEVPFELNETQVRFVANEAIFIDEDAAKAALAPVAEIILAHPDHPILLAGTTAQWGSQDSCVNLSNRRAGAVKDLLVNYFGVPESQLFTAGLGYADDPFVRGQDVDSNGNFVETEGAKNRRVVVLDAESDIARQILGN